MYDKEAQKTLVSEPSHGLAHLYHNNRRGFVQEPGLKVIGAGIPQMNGWYHRRDASLPGSAEAAGCSHEKWIETTGGRPWYEKDDGYYILRHARVGPRHDILGLLC